MKIQSLSILVPTKGCVNKCKFCVSCMHDNKYRDLFKENQNEWYYQFKKKLKMAITNGCIVGVLTGTGEPLQNKEFLEVFSKINQSLETPLFCIELQTSGVMLTDENLQFLKSFVKVDTISISLSSIFDSDRNAEICGTPEKLKFNIDELCKKIKDFNFNLRLSLNMTKDYDNINPEEIFKRASELKANQVTIRKLYSSGENRDVDKWVEENAMNKDKFKKINTFIKKHGTTLEILPFGAIKYSYKKMGVVVDADCMAKEVKDVYKYLILREDARLYSRWDDEASLIF
jgi:hypothetical protein